MTNWMPDIAERSGPKYRAIAEALADDIAAKTVPAGDRLPTHRDLAWRLGVTVGTVSRAYALAQSWGLIAGEVGRGTVVLPETRMRPIPPGEPARDYAHGPLPDRTFFPGLGRAGTIEMSRNFPTDERLGDILARGLRRIADPATLAQFVGYQPPNGAELHRRAGVDWLQRFGLEVDAESVMVVNGCQHGLAVAFSALARPGDTILMEALTWPGAMRLATMLGLRARAVDMDEHGLRPDALEEACRAGRARILYTVPTMQNPTTSVMPEDRRREIAAIARKHAITIVEDDVFGFLATGAPPPIAAIAPDITVYVTSLSKSVAPALRAGYVAAPRKLIPELASVIQTSMLMLPMFGAHLAAELVLSGAAAELADRQRQMATDRQALASRILAGHSIDTHPGASQFWLHLPDQWRTREFVSEAMERGVAVSPGDAFAVEAGESNAHTVRLCLCSEPGRARIEEGLEIIAALLASHPGATTPIV